jgi:hypothetical protein
MEDGHRPTSENLQQDDIEDVLNSIRRLVSQQPAAAAAGASRGRLILTPAFRVDRPAGTGQIHPLVLTQTQLRPSELTNRPQPAPHEEPDFPEPATQAWPGEAETAADRAAQAAEAAARTVAEASMLAALRRAVSQPTPAMSQQKPDAGRATHTAVPTGRAQAMDQEDDLRTEALERTIAELEAVIGASAQDWDPDGSELAHDSAPMQETRLQDSLTFEASQFDARTDPEAAGEAKAAFDPAPEPQVPGMAAAAPAPVTTAETDADTTEILDEEALRAIIARVLREELQGPLGERITRNVRKMVRAEIARALSERSFG